MRRTFNCCQLLIPVKPPLILQKCALPTVQALLMISPKPGRPINPRPHRKCRHGQLVQSSAVLFRFCFWAVAYIVVSVAAARSLPPLLLSPHGFPTHPRPTVRSTIPRRMGLMTCTFLTQNRVTFLTTETLGMHIIDRMYLEVVVSCRFIITPLRCLMF